MLFRVIGVCQVSDARDRFKDFAELDLTVIPAYECTAVAVVNVCTDDAFECIKMFFVELDAGSTGDAFEDK